MKSKIKNKKLYPTGRAAILGAVLIGLFSCSESDNKAEIDPSILVIEEAPPIVVSYSQLKTNGTEWQNQEGQKVDLRGINLGNWLGMEMWMFGSDAPIGDGIEDQCRLESKLEERFGAEEKDGVIKSHRDSWIKESDWDQMKAAGFNLIRVPFLFDLIEDPNNPYTIKTDAWHYLDQAIAAAKAREMYVLLDLHGAVGRQGWEQHTGCADKNELWDNGEYKLRTAWLWQQIAEKYQGESTVAGYGLLNEPWGTDAETLKEVVVDLYDAIREIDQEHIVVFPAHNEGGISAYEKPAAANMNNVAFEHHAYPGIFGWGEIGYQVHRDWLTCGEFGDTGVCDLAQTLVDVDSPLLIGEMQPWTGLGELGGDITRATFDRYNELDWAVTAWSYKTTSFAGGLGQGPWGLVTNSGDQLLVKAQTWGCNDWESTFDNACDVSARSTVPYTGEGSKTMYLVIKTGAFNGTDVIYDNIALTDDATGDNILLNGDFGSNENWTELAIWGDPRTYDFNYNAGEFAGSDTGEALRITSAAGNHSLIYQAIDVVGGQSYTILGKFKDNGDANNDMWAEVYLVSEMPEEWVDVTGRVLLDVDVNSSTLEEINAFFTSFGNMDYVINQAVIDNLTTDEPSAIFASIPGKAGNVEVLVTEVENTLSWEASSGEVTGYDVYRSTSPSSNFQVVSEQTETTFVDTDIESETVYYYYVIAFNELDEGYPSITASTGETILQVPGRLEAENYSAAHAGVETEATGDAGGGFNIGHFEIGRWVEYQVTIETAGEYTVEFRVASEPGSDGFEILLDDTVLDTVTVDATGGWQAYQTKTVTLTLPAGEASLILNSVGDQWNLNWINFIKN